MDYFSGKYGGDEYTDNCPYYKPTYDCTNSSLQSSNSDYEEYFQSNSRCFVGNFPSISTLSKKIGTWVKSGSVPYTHNACLKTYVEFCKKIQGNVGSA